MAAIDTDLEDLDPEDSVPLKQQIAERVAAAIRAGRLSPGDRVPGENPLMARYSVSRSTAREALAVLAASGLITKVPKVGTFVRSQKRLTRKPRRYSRDRQSAPFATEVKQAGARPDFSAESTLVDAVPDVSERLALSPGAQVMRTTYVYRADGHPVQLATSHEPAAITAGTPVAVPESGPLAGAGVIARMDSIGVHIDAVMEEVSVRPPTPAEAATLLVPDGVHVFAVQREYRAASRPIEIADIVIPGDRYSLVYAFSVPDAGDPSTSDAPD